MINPQIREEVPDEHVGSAERAGHPDERGDGESNANIAQDDELRVLGLVERAGGVEVVDTGGVPVLLPLAAALLLVLVVVVSRHVGEEVQPPPRQLLANQVEQSSNGGLLGQLVELVHEPGDAAGVHLARLGDEDHVLLHVAGGLVVLAVRDLPGEVGNQQRGVADPADGVVDDFRGREGLVAAFVG